MTETLPKEIHRSESEVISCLKQEIEAYKAQILDLKQSQTAERRHREEVEQELKASQHMLQLVMDALPVSIFWKDKNLVYMGCNQRFAVEAGVGSPQDIKGKTDYDLAWQQEEADFFRTCDRAVIASGTAEIGIVEPQRQDSGKQAWLETNKIPLHDADSNIIGILGSYQDVTDRKQAEVDIQAANEKLNRQAVELQAALDELGQYKLKLEDLVDSRTNQLKTALDELKKAQQKLIQTEKMSSLGQLVAGIAHEINNPASFIKGNLSHVREYFENMVELLQLYQEHYSQPSEDIQSLVETVELSFIQDDFPKLFRSMQEGICRIQDIVLKLRNFSRLDEADCKIVNIHDGLDSALLLLNHRLRLGSKQSAIKVIKEYGTVPPVECYAGYLNQVYLHILTNAIDAIESNLDKPEAEQVGPRGEQIRIQTSVVCEEWVQIIISDSGIGIPESERSNIFNPFFTTKPVGTGTGMGMAISHQIVVEKHRGSLEFFSKPNEGTEFVIRIPIRQVKLIQA